jgi:hypothetical protein
MIGITIYEKLYTLILRKRRKKVDEFESMNSMKVIFERREFVGKEEEEQDEKR